MAAFDLLELAARVSGGDRVDWEAAERAAARPEERRAVRHLRLIESIARVHAGGEHESAERDELAKATAAARDVLGRRTTPFAGL